MVKVIILVFSLLLLNLQMLGQKTEPQVKPGKPNELDKQYNPGNSSSLQGGSSTDDGGGPSTEVKNIVKLNFGLFVRNTFAVHYQRRITDDFSVQGGIGYCYGTDRAYLLTDGDDFSLTETKSDLRLGAIVKNGSFRQGANPFLAASVRFNFNGWYSSYYGSGDGNSYIDLGIRYVGQHYFINKLSDNSGTIAPSSVAVRNTWYTLIYGYQVEAGRKLITTHEFYVGGGIRKSTFDAFQMNQIQNPYTYSYDYQYSKSGSRDKMFSIAVVIGYVLGFGF
jgi:hypothetical protein